MGLFSFFQKNEDLYQSALNDFSKTREAALLYSNLKFYMGYSYEEVQNPSIKKRVMESYNRLVSFGISYVTGDPLMKSLVAEKIYNELEAIRACDFKLECNFEYEFFRLFRIEEPHRFGRGELYFEE